MSSLDDLNGESVRNINMDNIEYNARDGDNVDGSTETIVVPDKMPNNRSWSERMTVLTCKLNVLDRTHMQSF